MSPRKVTSCVFICHRVGLSRGLVPGGHELDCCAEAPAVLTRIWPTR